MATRVLAAVQNLQKEFLGVIMMVMTFAYTLNVLVREIAPRFASTFIWIEEMCLFGMVWMVFLSLGLALESGRHIAMRMVLTRMPPRLARIAKLTVNVVGLLFSLYLAKVGFEITMFVARSGQISPTLNISVAWLYWVLPVGFALLALKYLLEIVTPADRFSIEIDPMHQV